MKTTQHEQPAEHAFDPQQSLALISSMIDTAKHKLADDGFLFIFWGWLVSICALAHFSAIRLNIPHGELAWAILMPLGGIFSGIYSFRKRRQQKVKTYIDTYLGYVWGAFIIALFIALGFMPLHGIRTTYFFLMVLYGIATFVTGGMLGFKPLIFGSLVSFGCAIAATFFGEVEQLLWIAVALVGSYVIPGHMLRAKYKSQVHAQRA